ncbi:MipA/OmpV family protein [Tropicibacter sp. R16_0]|uniref:MipA/OmpV family protein n=1 Tax=Tropicibacter sp. R16_0 TaxID=2821102 RepID=UPI001ADC9BEC|nr:MipA/OmpV family protein [Tropicibacter sp. R16_0]MBO9451296.1 MipA/OmpV family protein [Tropicibacter sp. R16_0]
MTLSSLARLALAAAVATVFVSVAAVAQPFDGPDGEDDGGDWDFFVGAGVSYEPEYEGSDKYKTEALPGFQAVWRDRFLISPQGIGAFIVNQERLRVSASIGYGGGRKQKDSVYLDGLGDIKDGAAFNLGAQYDLGGLIATADVTKFGAGSKGTLVSLGLQSEVPFGVVRGLVVPTGQNPRDAFNDRSLILTGGISVDWADENYNQAFFGVTPTQSAASGLGQYSAGSGAKSVNAEIGFAKPLGENWGLTGAVTYSHLLGDAADSPIVKSQDSFSASLFVGFNF